MSAAEEVADATAKVAAEACEASLPRDASSSYAQEEEGLLQEMPDILPQDLLRMSEGIPHPFRE